MSIKDLIINKLQREYIGIENRDDINDDEKVKQIINITASVCAAVAFQPIPFADIFILTPIQAYMGSRIASIRGIKVSSFDIKESIVEISKVIGLGLVAQQVAIGAYKTGLPFLGGFMTLPLVFGLTYGIGQVMDFYLINKAKGELISPEKLKEIWKRAKKEGKTSADRNKAKHFSNEISKEKTIIRFLKTNLDEMLILASFQSIQGGFFDIETNEMIIAAFKRYSKDTQDPESIQNYLNNLSEEQITGVVSNVKGILHEMEFVKLENADGDKISAVMFPEANHKGFDILMNDSNTGEIWEVQLKTTDNKEYVQEWLNRYPDGEILLSEEIAKEMGLETSGISNEELTEKVSKFVDNLIGSGMGSSMWNMFPTLSLISVSIIILEFYKRFQNGEINEKEFQEMVVRASGIKVSKIAILMVILSIPVINVAVSTGMIARIIYSLTQLKNNSKKLITPKQLTQSDLTKPLKKI